MHAEQGVPEKEKKSFWNSTIGLITKITAVLTALTALVIAYKNFTKAVAPETNSSSSVNVPSRTTDNAGTDVTGEKTDTASSPAPAEPAAVERKSDIRISAFSLQPSEITLDEDAKPKAFTASLEAYNNGNALAENCSFTLSSDGGVIGNATSESFSVDPGTKKSVQIIAAISNSGKITAKLSCSNDTEKSSDPVYLTVYAHGTIHHVIPKIQQ